VITTAFTFIASTNAIAYVGAEPVFVDINPVSFTLDPDAIEAAITPRTRAVLPVDLYGNPADLVRIQEICNRHGLALIDDASQAHGAATQGKPVGSFGTATFSFYPSKNMTTAEGGMITTDSLPIAEAARKLRHHGTQQTYIHDRIGYNFRLTNMAAAIGIVQLKHLRDFNERRIANAAYLTEKLAGLSTPVVRPGDRHVFHQYTIRLPKERDRFSDDLKARGIETRVYYPLPVHRQPAYAGRGFERVFLPHTDRAAEQVLSLPVHPSLSSEELEYIAATVLELWS